MTYDQYLLIQKFMEAMAQLLDVGRELRAIADAPAPPLVLTGQGDFERAWPKETTHVQR